MSRTYYHNEGYTRGGLDVVTGVNLFFKGLLLFPIFVLAAFVGLTMIKHVLFNGIPSMNGPTEEQSEAIRARDEARVPSGYSVPVPALPGPTDYKEATPYSYEAPQRPYVEPTAIPLGGLGRHQEEPQSETWTTEIEVDPFSKYTL